MKIGFDAKRAFHNTTGLGNYSRDLIRILANYYPTNSYLLYNTKPKKVKRLQLTTNMIEVLPKLKIWKKLSSIWRQGPVSEQIINDGVSIFHGLSGEIPRGLAGKEIKTVVTIHDLIFIRYPKLYSFFDRKIHFNKFKYAAEKADKVIAISEQTKKDIVDFLKIDASKIEVLYQGCHHVFKEERTLEEKEAFKKKYNLPDKFISNIGTIEERKNALSIVKAIKDIDVNLVVVGRKTEYYKEIEKYIVEHKLEGKVFFLEHLSLKELSIVYQASEIFIYPSIFEGFGIPIIEALYSKTPVITTAGGVFPEAGGPNSIYIEKNNINSLKLAIANLLKNENLRKKMTTEGYNFVQKFNDEVIVKKLMNIYIDL